MNNDHSQRCESPQAIETGEPGSRRAVDSEGVGVEAAADPVGEIVSKVGMPDANGRDRDQAGRTSIRGRTFREPWPRLVDTDLG